MRTGKFKPVADLIGFVSFHASVFTTKHFCRMCESDRGRRKSFFCVGRDVPVKTRYAEPSPAYILLSTGLVSLFRVPIESDGRASDTAMSRPTSRDSQQVRPREFR
jgi:hypothetical protein